MRTPERPGSTGRFARRAVRMLLDRDLLTAGEVHRYGVVARDVSESNDVVLVEIGNGRGLAVKDMAGPRDGGQGDPAREIALYRAADRLPGAGGLLPRLVRHDTDEHMLVIQGLPAARRLDRLTAPDDPLDPGLAGRFGHALGAWHHAAAGLTALAAVRPWLLDLDGPDRLPVLDREPRLGAAAAAITGDPAHAAAIAAVATAWTADTVVHGDIRFANVLVHGPQLTFVDWESAGRGDACWDVAGGVQEYLSAGGTFHPVAGASPTVSAFLAGYARGRGRPVDPVRLAPFVAARLLVRALQLVTWLPDPDAEVHRHRDLARGLGPPTRT
jgi:hypothetical protein